MTLFKKVVRVLSTSCFLWFIAHGLAHAITSPAPHHPTEYEKNWASNLSQDIQRDFKNYFKSDNLLILGDTFLAAGVLANTGLDRAFRNHWQTDLRTKSTDHVLAIPRTIGGLSYYYGPLFLISMGVGHLREHTALGNVVYNWGYRSLRTFLIGGIQQVFLTNLLGGGRPKNNQDSKWQPFRYQTGVSGHAFYGAIPLLTAAMMSDPPLLKYGLYAFSVLPGVSRINGDCHYLSQVILGWTLAFLSARSVYQSDSERQPAFQMGVYPKSDGAMLGGQLKF